MCLARISFRVLIFVFVELQSFSLSRKRQAFLIECQGGMSMEDLPEEVPPMSRRKIQEEDRGVDHRWAAIYQAVAKRRC